MSKLDLSRFKKVSADKDYTVMQHEDGHQLKIAHSALSPKMRGQLAAIKMAAGGDPGWSQQDKQDFDRGASGQAKPTPTQSTTTNGPGGVSVDSEDAAEAGERQTRREAAEKAAQPVQAQANGGQVADNSDQSLGQIINYPGADPAPKPSPSPRKNYADGTPDQPVSQDDSADPATISVNMQDPQVDPNNVNPNPPSNQGGITNSQQPQDLPYGISPEDYAQMQQQQQQSDPSSARSPAGGAPPTQQNTSDPYGNDTYSDTLTHGINEQKSANVAQYKADTALGQLQNTALQQAQQRNQQLLGNYNTHNKDLTSERQNFMQDVQNDNIDPSHYLSSHGVPQKIATAIGLIMGGIGGAGQAGGNPALNFLNAQIDRDINAQKANLGKKQSLLNANMLQFRNLRDATDMTRLMQNDIVSNQLRQAAAKTTDMAAKARALQAAGQLDMQTAPIQSQLAMRKAMMTGAQQGIVSPDKIVGWLVPPEERPAAEKALTEAMNTSNMKDSILNSFDTLDKYNTLGNRALHMGFTPGKVASARDPFTAELSKGTAGRFSDADAHMIATLWPEMGDSPSTVEFKRTKLNELVSTKMSFPELTKWGIDPNKLGQFNGHGQSNFQMQAPVKK